MRPSTTFALSKDRGHQLRLIARELGVSVAELIARWIDREIIESDLRTDRAVVDIVVSEDGGTVAFAVELFGVFAFRLDPFLARLHADAIEKVVAGDSNTGLAADALPPHVLPASPPGRGTGVAVHPLFDGKDGAELRTDAGFVSVRRQGTGIVIEALGFKRSMPAYEAREIAKALRDAAEPYLAARA